jgi:RimJ/RimL family protein N-acetyltransferase
MLLRPSYPILTDRLALRPFVVDDITAMLSYRSRADVCRYLPFEPQDRTTLLERLSGPALSRSDLTAEDQALTLGAWRRDSGELAGDVILFLRSGGSRPRRPPPSSTWPSVIWACIAWRLDWTRATDARPRCANDW